MLIANRDVTRILLGCVLVLLPTTATAQSQQNATAEQNQQSSAEFAQRVQQQHAAQLAADERAAEQRVAARPFPEVPAEQAKYLDELLDYWQQNSDQIKQYTCAFKRFEYDTGIVNYRDPVKNQLAAHSVATGEIRFADPDKGFYETSEVWDFKAPPKNAGEEADYGKRAGDGQHEKWICDGRNIYEFDYTAKRLYETEIPQTMQGGGLANSPLPFLFGANKELLLERYWVRVVTPEGATGEYWLEAYPKRVEDARSYSRIEIIIDEDDFLPKAMHMYSPQYDPAKNNLSSRYFAFENRRVNNQLDKFKDFFNIFVRPQTPIAGGWKRVTRSALDQQQATPDSLRGPSSAQTPQQMR